MGGGGMLTVGIVGLPNAGKSTLFNALTRSRQATVAAYPFCTIEPNVGVIEVPDERLDRLLPIYGSAKKLPAAVEFFDIAGLVRGASQGEGLGNRFLGHIREVDAIVEVVRCFEEQDVAHVDGSLDPVRDVETIRTELALADLETLQKRKEKVEKIARAGNKEARAEMEVLERLEAALDEHQSVRGIEMTEAEREQTQDVHLLTGKPVIYIANVTEAELGGTSEAATRLLEYAASLPSESVVVCAELEAQLADLSPEEAAEYLSELDAAGTGTEELIRTAYRALGLITFFTGNEKELRARAIPQGAGALEAAGHVHSDIQRGFIGAEVIAYDLLVQEESIHRAREEGKLRLEGKEYEVRDGDVIFFRFNV
jgi:GTP-binding protein YchF